MNIAQLDDLVDHIERLSPAVDDLALCVYPPIRNDVVHKQVLWMSLVFVHQDYCCH